MRKKLLVIAGPTAVGKTDYSIEAALRCGSPVISCDSRQIYKEMTIGTAVPDASQLAAVKHYFIHSISVLDAYSSGQYEIDALALMEKLFSEGHETLVMAEARDFTLTRYAKGLTICLFLRRNSAKNLRGEYVKRGWRHLLTS